METNKLKELMAFEGNSVIVEVINDEPMFEIYSTGSALGYSRWNESKGKQYFKIEKSRIDKVLKNAEISTLAHGGTTFITESQLYDFMLEAKTEKCKPFRKWVVNEVLPTIRKTGGIVDTGREEEFIRNYFPSFSEDVKLSMVQDLLKTNKELKPKGDYYDKVLKPANLRTATEIAKDLGLSARSFNSKLHQLGVIQPRSVNGKTKGWLTYAKYDHMIPDYFDYHISEHGQSLKFTEKGREWVINFLKEKQALLK